MNIFRLFQKWKRKGTTSTKTVSEVLPSAPVIPIEVLGEKESNGPANSVLHQAGINSAIHANAVGGDTARWLGAGGTATVAGRNIGGMVYLAPEQRQSVWGQMSRPVIDPGLPVWDEGNDLSGDSMPYWPSYSGIGPQARATYLDWLASGRSDKRYSVGYVFLYFYGLERRFFIDKPNEDEKELLIAEVERLLRVYGDNRSVKGLLVLQRRVVW